MQKKNVFSICRCFNNSRTSDDNGTGGPDSSSEDSVPCLVSNIEYSLMFNGVPFNSYGRAESIALIFFSLLFLFKIGMLTCKQLRFIFMYLTTFLLSC